MAGCTASTVNWGVQVGPGGSSTSCSTSTITVSATKFNSNPALTYTASTTSSELVYTDADAPNSDSSLSCGALTWTFTKSDDTALPPIFSLATGKLIVNTANYADASIYNLKVTASYVNYPSVTDS